MLSGESDHTVRHTALVESRGLFHNKSTLVFLLTELKKDKIELKYIN